MQVFDRYRNPLVVKFAQFPAGEWRLETPVDRDIVIEASGMEPDFWVKAGLLSASASNRGHGVMLVLPYLPAARDDKGLGAFVYGSLIDALLVDTVHVFDAHSPIMGGSMANKVVNHMPTAAIVASTSDVGGVLCPDKGAVDRASAVAAALDVPLVCASKKRDFATGRLSGFECPPLPEIDGTWLVVDDICDGGGTFSGLARASGVPKEKLQLWVSHAVFSGNARALVDHYCQITTTNSFMSLTDVPCTKVPVHAWMKGIYKNHG